MKASPRKLILIQKEVKKFDNIFKNITKNMKNFYEKKKNEFEKFIEDECPVKNE